jgi:hypothetical protein
VSAAGIDRARLADGIERAIREAGLARTVHRFGPRSGTTLAAAMPRNAEESRTSFDPELFRSPCA